MTLDHVADTVFRAATFRAMHGLSPGAAALLAIGIVVVGLYLRRRN